MLQFHRFWSVDDSQVLLYVFSTGCANDIQLIDYGYRISCGYSEFLIIDGDD